MKNMQNKTKIDTFSANSLEILNNSKEEFNNKYIFIFLRKKNLKKLKKKANTLKK